MDLLQQIASLVRVCLAYALARQLGEPLLCKGDDLARTDLDLVLPPAPQT